MNECYNQGFSNALKWVKEMKEIEEEVNEKLSFLGGFAAAFRDQIHTDIEVKPGHSGPSLFAHRALLVSLLPLSIYSFTCKSLRGNSIGPVLDLLFNVHKFKSSYYHWNPIVIFRVP